jgi:hypothetical protein
MDDDDGSAATASEVLAGPRVGRRDPAVAEVTRVKYMYILG